MRKFSWLLISIGILLILIPIIGRGSTYLLENRIIANWKSGQIEPSKGLYFELNKAYNKLADIIDMESKSEQGLSQTLLPSNNKKKNLKYSSKAISQEMLGIIEIDKIKVNLPIVEGVEKENLRVGIGHIPGTAALGTQGNCSLAGHRSYTLGRFFNRLDELNIGDKIIIITRNQKYTYKIYEKLVVTPDNLSVLKDNGKESIITLITCTPIYIATHRLIIHARLVKSSDFLD